MIKLNTALALAATGGMLTFGNVFSNAQDIIRVDEQKELSSRLMKALPLPRTAVETGVKRLPQRVTQYDWDMVSKEYVEFMCENFGYDELGNKTSYEQILQKDKRMYTEYSYDEDNRIATSTEYVYNDVGINPVNPYTPVYKYFYKYDDVVTDFVISIERQSRYKDGWTNDLMFPGRIEIELTRDSQQRVVRNNIIGDNENGFPYRQYIDIEYTGEKTLNAKRYVGKYDEDIYTDSLFDVKMYKNSGQFMKNAQDLNLRAFITTNNSFGAEVEYVENRLSNGTEYTRNLYDENGIHVATSIVTLKDNTNFAKGATLKYVIDGDKIVEDVSSGIDLNNDGIIAVGDDYVLSVALRDIYLDEYGNEYKCVRYKTKINHAGGMSEPTHADELSSEVSKEFNNVFNYDEDGTLLDVTFRERSDVNDEFTNTRKIVYEDFVDITPTAIRDAEDNTPSLSYADGEISLGAMTEYSVFDMEGRMVMNGVAEHVYVDALAGGMYIVKAGGETMKFVK